MKAKRLIESPSNAELEVLERLSALEELDVDFIGNWEFSIAGKSYDCSMLKDFVFEPVPESVIEIVSNYLLGMRDECCLALKNGIVEPVLVLETLWREEQETYIYHPWRKKVLGYNTWSIRDELVGTKLEEFVTVWYGFAGQEKVRWPYICAHPSGDIDKLIPVISPAVMELKAEANKFRVEPKKKR